MKQVQLKYFDETEKISLNLLEKIFLTESIEVIDKAIYLAKGKNISYNSILSNLEEDYDKLSKNERSTLD